MPLPTPPIVTEAFAQNAAPAQITFPIPVDSQIGVNPGAASFNDGFPPENMTPLVAGGIPPFGQDMNGILFMLSSHTAFTQGGQWYAFDATVAAQIGGYALGTYLAMADGSGFWLSTANANSTDPDAGGFGWTPLPTYGQATVAVSVGVVTLTPAAAKKRVIVVTGALSGNAQLVFPARLQEWLVVNLATGAFTVNVTAAGSSTQVAILPGINQPTGIWGDGVNLYPMFQPATAQAYSQNPTPLSLAQRTNAGYLLATYFNQNSPVEDAGIGAVFYQNLQADGYLRKSSTANFIAQLGLATRGYVDQAKAAAIAVTNTYPHMFVRGMVMMFSGPTIPAGWRLCDGGGGTPDLRSRFVIGAGGPALGAVAPLLSAANLPKHTHGSTVYVGNAGAQIGPLGSGAGGQYFTSGNGAGIRKDWQTDTGAGLGASAPPNTYALYFIMYLG